MFLDDEHHDVSLSDFDAFQKWVFPYLIENMLDRNSADLPDWFVPLARGAATPSRYLLRKAGYGRGYRRPPGWLKGGQGKLFKEYYRECLVVTPCGPFWRIEREGTSQRPHRHINTTLAHFFGPTPILARNVQAAICLSEFYFLKGTPSGLYWAQGCPDDVSGAIEYAQQRRINEAMPAYIHLSSAPLSGEPMGGSSIPDLVH